ncbi:MAG: EAL domain-containing protein, partial [Rhodoferax sp.]|uniref:bifunctional diguanylate cyclase/phosphodiesterase n=1 Tax=Rhodoferax sp. TaxID=50421 RepID=UPI0032664FB0
AAAWFCLLVGCVVLLGWLLQVPALTSIVPGLETMKVNAALCFVFAGGSLLFSDRAIRAGKSKVRGTHRRASVALAALVVLVAGVTLVQYLSHRNLGLDELLVKDPNPWNSPWPGRMSIASAINFALLGAALLLHATRRGLILVAQSLSVVALLVAMLAVFAYLFDADLHRVPWFSSVALHTAIGFCVLGGGILALRADIGWLSVYARDTASARLGRSFMVGTLVVLPAISALRTQGQRNFDLYGTYFGTAILTVSGMAALFCVNWLSTRRGNMADTAIENLNRTYAVLSGINNLIVRCGDKKALFQEACHIARETGQFSWAWIASLDNPKGEPAVWFGDEDKLSLGLERRLSQLGATGAKNALLQRVLATKAPVIWNDLAHVPDCHPNDARRNAVLEAHGIHALIALPLMVDDKVAGFFVLHAKEKGFFDADEVRLLKELADDIGFAVGAIERRMVLSNVAYYDPLTGLANRTLFLERLGREFRAAKGSTSQRTAVVLIDLRQFRKINESYGRATADKLLQDVATRLQQAGPWPENLARLQADCFAVFVPHVKGLASANRIHTLFSAALAAPFQVKDASLSVEFTAGIAVYPKDGGTPEDVLAHAETALERCKASGAGYLFYQPALNARVAKSLTLENKLRSALELGHFVLHYQPKVDFDRQVVDSVEALIRWNDPELGLVPPGKFLPLLEETGLIASVGTWALGQAVQDIAQWRAMGLRAPRCAVNVSPVQLRDRDFATTLLDALAGFGAAEPLLDLEIAEGVLLENLQPLSDTLQAVRSAGVMVAVDNFGTGCSSLASLSRLPIHLLKVDRSFVQAMVADPQAATIVEATISLAHALHLKVVAEGVETQEQSAALRCLGCDRMQGDLFCPPMPFDDIARMLPRV